MAKNYEVYVTVFQMPEDYSGHRFFPIYNFSREDASRIATDFFVNHQGIPVFRGLLITDGIDIARNFPSKVSLVVEKSNVAEDLNMKGLEALFE